MVDGNKEFFIFYQKHNKEIQSIIYNLTRNPFITEEITQLVYLKLWQKNIYKKADNNFNYLYTIIRNTIIDFFRKEQNYEKKIEKLKKNFHTIKNKDEISNHYSKNNNIVALQEIINSFDLEKREIYTLYYKKEKSIKEISEILGIPVGTVKSRLYYIREKITKIIKSKQTKKTLETLKAKGVR